jgi:hypothetical protein
MQANLGDRDWQIVEGIVGNIVGGKIFYCHLFRKVQVLL